MDITFDSVTPTADDPVRVTFVANNMTDNIQVDILYYCPEHGWEVLQGEKISDNQVAAYFHAGSSVMALIYREKGATVGTSQVFTADRCPFHMANCSFRNIFCKFWYICSLQIEKA